MRLFKTLFIFGFLGFIFWGCGGGGGGEEQRFFALTNSPEVVVGGIKGSVNGGATVRVRNLSTGQVRETTASEDGSFVITLDGSIGDTIGISAPSVDVAVEVMLVSEVSPEIRQEIMSGAVRRSLAQLGSVPTAIEIRGNRAYVVNGFSNNIQVFNLSSGTPQEIGTIVVPSGPPLGPRGSDPIAIAFLDDTIAYVANFEGQSVAVVNVETRQCEFLIVRSDLVPSDASICQNQVITVDPEFFEDPSDIAIANSKVYVSNDNLDEFFQPLRNGFITVIDSETNQVMDSIEASGANSGGITFINGNLYVVNRGNTIFDLATSAFSCDFRFPPSIDVINTQSDTIVDTIDIPVSAQNPLVCSPNRIEPTPDERFGYLGLGLVGALLKVDLENNTVVNGPSNPIIVTDLSGLNFTADIKIRNDGLGFITLFNTDQVAVFDTATDEINPFPFIAFFPAGFKADNPDSEFSEGVQSLAIRPGIPGVDFQGADIFFITGLSQQLGSINTALILPPE